MGTAKHRPKSSPALESSNHQADVPHLLAFFTKTARRLSSPSSTAKPVHLLRRVFFVATVKFLYPTCSVYKDFLPCVKRMRSRTDLYLDKRIGFSIFPLNGLRRAQGRARKKAIIARGIQENDLIVGWMYVFFHKKVLHFSYLAKVCKILRQIASFV